MEPELASLIQRFDDAEVMSDTRARELWKQVTAERLKAMAANACTEMPLSQNLSILDQLETEFRAALKAADNNLLAQVAIVDEALSLWFSQGQKSPPYYPWRIAVILSKAGRKDDERLFLKAWNRHFGATVGGRYTDLVNRVKKLG